MKKNNNKITITKLIKNSFNNLSTLLHGFFEAFISSLRFSISFRISLIYFRLLLTSLFFIVFIYTIGYIILVAPKVYEQDKLIYNQIMLKIEEDNLSQGYIEELTNVTNKEMAVLIDNRIAYSSVEYEKALDHNRIYYDKGDKLFFYINRFEKYIEETDSIYKIVFIHPLKDYFKILGNILIFVIIIEFFRMVSIVRKGSKVNKKVLLPIKDMTETTKNISGKNLSHRINVAGTKNELKDLAKTINDMMDRIEVSYNSQKQFVSDASHELRTPIAVIQGYANLLNRWGKDDKEVLEESILAIKNESENMKDLVEKLLFLARHDKKTLKLKKENFHLKPMLEEMIKETKMINDTYNIECEITCSPIIYGDKQAIKQAVRIFLDNAIKYTPEDGKVILSCKKHNEGCLVSVKDTGIGISNNNLKKIFDRFYRVDTARIKEKNGHGLGLSIAKLIILAHQGKITVRSKINEGSTFSIWFEVVKWN
ncbi:MAG: sensor histidine kinase [Eubacteriales bacterium]